MPDRKPRMDPSTIARAVDHDRPAQTSLAALARLADCAGFSYWPATGAVEGTDAGWRLLGMPTSPASDWVAVRGRFDAPSQRALDHAISQLSDGGNHDAALELALADASALRLHALLRPCIDPVAGVGIVIWLRPRSESAATAEDLEVDSLTGLSNRRGLQTQGALSIAAARRHGRQLALLFIDLDHFKQVNDNLGHAAGDELLRVVARRLRACVRGSDVVARQSGDEFVVILSEVQRPQDAAMVAQKILDALQQPVALDEQSIGIECSIGVAMLSEAMPDLAALMRAADTAMYAAKEAGRHNVRFYSDAWSLREQRRAATEASLSQALARDELFLVYQPCVRLSDGRAVAAEALLRWRQADGSVRAPAEFLRLAEDSGDIVEIGAWALEQACVQAKAWADAGVGFERVVLNVSAPQLRDDGFAAQVAAICERSGWPASAVELEFNDALLTREREAARRNLGALQALGVAVVLDDFGNGVGNLMYLRRYGVRGIKLHRQFAFGFDDDNALREVSAALIGLGRALGLRVAAKGVEDLEVAQFMRAQGCDEAQGFHFARPMLGPDVELWSLARGFAQRAAPR